MLAIGSQGAEGSRRRRAEGNVPRYYFDIQDSELTPDEEGMEFADVRDAAMHAIEALPAIAAHEPQNDLGIRDALVVLVRDDNGLTIYSAKLTLVGTWMPRCAMPTAQPESVERVEGSKSH
jgi:hypothetical protein